MKRKSISTWMVLILFASIAHSQSDFRNGYYITLENDTIYGLLDYRGDIRNAQVCVFKKDAHSAEQKFDPGTIHSYRFMDSKYYVSKKVKLENGWEGTVFTEYLINGIADLFYFKDDFKEHFLLETKDGKLYELTNEENEVYMEGKGRVVKNSNKYIGLLNYSFADCREIQNEIDNAKLTKESLIDIVKDYHDYVCDGEKCIIYEKTLRKFKANFALTTGYHNTNLEFVEDKHFSNFGILKSKAFQFGFNLKMLFPGISEKLSINFSSDFTKDYFYGFTTRKAYYSDLTTNEYLHINLYTIDAAVPLVYSYPKGKVIPVFGVGLVGKFTLKEDSKLITEEIKPTETTTTESYYTPLAYSGMGGQILAGLNFRIKEKREIITNISYSYIRNFDDDIINFKVFAFKVGFQF